MPSRVGKERARELESWKRDKAVQDNITESWLCVDCGRNTASGVLNGPTARRQLKRRGKHKTRITTKDEIYTLRNATWKKARMEAWGGCLCVGCIEKRLRRKLTPKDFDWEHPFNGFPCTRRLLNRRKYTLLKQDKTLYYLDGCLAVMDLGRGLIKAEIPWSPHIEFEYEVTNKHRLRPAHGAAEGGRQTRIRRRDLPGRSASAGRARRHLAHNHRTAHRPSHA